MANTKIVTEDGIAIEVVNVEGSVYNKPGAYRRFKVTDINRQVFEMELTERECDVLRIFLA